MIVNIQVHQPVQIASSLCKVFTSKCVPERPESTLSVPPWTGSLNPVQYSHLNASLFTVSEVEKVIINYQ